MEVFKIVSGPLVNPSHEFRNRPVITLRRTGNNVYWPTLETGVSYPQLYPWQLYTIFEGYSVRKLFTGLTRAALIV